MGGTNMVRYHGEAADAFSVPAADDAQPRAKRRRRRRVPGAGGRTLHSSYDALQRFEKKELVRAFVQWRLNWTLGAERQKRSALAYDQQVLLAKMIRLETEIILLQAEGSQ